MIQEKLQLHRYMLFTGWEVRIGKNCARGLEYRPRPQAEGGTQTEGTVSPNTDRPRPVNNIFIFLHLRCKSFRKIFLTFQPMCIEVGHVHVDEARDRSQTKTKHYTMIFSSVIYIFWHSVLSFRVKKGFCVLLGNS